MAEERISERVRVRPRKERRHKDANLKGGARGGDEDALKKDDHVEPPIVQRTP